MKIHVKKFSQTQGSTIVVVLVMGAVLLISLAAYVRMLEQRTRAVTRSQSWNLCVPVAEAGLEEAMAHLNQRKSQSLTTNGWSYLGSSKWLKAYNIGIGRYSVTISNVSPPIVETEGSVESVALLRVSGTTNEVRRTLRVTTRFRPEVRGMVARVKATVQGTAQADSYNSTLGPYNPLAPGDNTFIGSVSTMSSQLEVVGDAKIYGDVATGAAGGLKLDSPAVIGDSAFVNNPANAGKVEAGHYTTTLNMPPASVPTTPFSGGAALSGGVVGGVAYTYVLDSRNFKVNGSLTMELTQGMLVTGDASLWVTDTLTLKDFAKITIAPGASLTVYVGNQFYMIGNAQANYGGLPEQLSYYGLSTSSEFYMNLSTKFVGVVYTPQAKMDISGDAEFFGAGYCKDLVLQGNSRFHYDEALSESVGQPFIITSWREL